MADIVLTVEDSVKSELEDMLSEMGMNLSTFFMICAKKVLRDRRISFYIEAPEK